MAIDIKPYKPVGETTLDSLEDALAVKFPAEYRSFLLQFNGGEPASNCFHVPGLGDGAGAVRCFFGITARNKSTDLQTNAVNMSGRLPEGFFPIAEDSCGNYICLRTKGKNKGAIYFWDHELESEDNKQPRLTNLTKVANGFEDFLSSLQPMEVVMIEGPPDDDVEFNIGGEWMTLNQIHESLALNKIDRAMLSADVIELLNRYY